MTKLAEQLMAHLNLEYYKSRSQLRITQDDVILDGNIPLGYLFWLWVAEENDLIAYMVLSLEEYKLHPNIISRRKELTKAASEMDIRVIFVNAIDIGFGLPTVKYSEEDICKQLVKVARYSQDKDIKTAICAVKGNQYFYSYNQKIYGKMMHAELALIHYLANNEENNVCPLKGYIDECKVYSLLEPCYNCLNGIIENGIKDITYYCLHKAKWNTDEYIQLTNDIYNKSIRNMHNYPIRYLFKNNNIVNKFYKIKESRNEKQKK